MVGSKVELVAVNSLVDNRHPSPVTVYREMRLPEPATPVGYAALIDAFDLKVPLPRTLSAIGQRHKFLERDRWRVFSPRHMPNSTLEGHLTFALKHEGLELAVLKSLFAASGPTPVSALVKSRPTGGYARRVWFLFEWLTGTRLDLPNAERGAYVGALDPKRQFAVPGFTSTRHHVRNNLPGTADFCPLVYRTDVIERFVNMSLQAAAQEAVAELPSDLLARTAAFLLLKDSKSSFAIEGENPPQGRIMRWGRAIGQAGQQPIDLEELKRLQRMVIGDERFVRPGLRSEGGFVGVHDRHSLMPIPDHVCARPEDLDGLLEGMIAFDRDFAQQLDPVIAAAVLAFGFVFAHPFEDGNGRLHRYLIHHVLAKRGFNPPGVVFPVSAAILDRISDYRAVLEDYSQRTLPVVDWHPTDRGNVWVSNDTGDFYRFFDATIQTEFLFESVQRTIEQDLPNESTFLRRYDDFQRELKNIVDMPMRLSDLLFRFLDQNGGILSVRRRKKEFAALTDAEVERLQSIYRELFKGAGDRP